MSLRCDIFCAVIDNFGDAGICWRLARQLAMEHGWTMRLWIDDPAPITLLAPGQNIVEICHWTGNFDMTEAADVVIEAFACNLPPRYVEAMKTRRPVWINLEYLSAENWVAGCHGLPSPQQGLSKYFFFPGFVTGTGGLLKEHDLAVLPVTEGSPNGTPTFDGRLEVSLFCYANPGLPDLLNAWRDGKHPVVCHVAAGLPQQQVACWLDRAFETGNTARRGQLTLHALPFLPQVKYDKLLERCHLNFVRGEDSFVRAQWAKRPFVWQTYPQADGAHIAKLDAFLALYTDEESIRNFFRSWNGVGPLDWPQFAATLHRQAAAAPAWTQKIDAQGDLASNLAKFCSARL